MSAPTVRPARPADATRLQSVERAAGRAFSAVGLPDIASAEPMPAERLVSYAAAGRAWVAADDIHGAVGYVVVDVVDTCAHIEQISVHPDHQGHGIGRRLIDAVEGWAAQHMLAALTLTTFESVPWNAPPYRHLGFRVLAANERSAGLRALQRLEARHGLDPARRVCMRREVASADAFRNG